MLKRFSSTLKGKKDRTDAEANGANGNGHAADFSNGHSKGTNGTNGVENGNESQSVPKAKRFSTFSMGGSKSKTPPPEQSITRSDVDSGFDQFAQLLHAARRPLPTQTGDGSYVDQSDVPSSLFQDMKSLGFKDVKTLREVMKGKASGGPADDKTMLMERVIQVSSLFIYRKIQALLRMIPSPGKLGRCWALL